MQLLLLILLLNISALNSPSQALFASAEETTTGGSESSNAETAANQVCANESTCSDPAFDNTRQAKELCTIYPSKDESTDKKYDAVHCSEKELEYLYDMDAKSLAERQEESSKFEQLLKKILEQNPEDEGADDESGLWVAKQYNILKQLDDIHKFAEPKPDNIQEEEGDRFGPNGDKLISPTLLATKVGKGGASAENPIWLAVLGKVFDVTKGEDFYKFGGGGYSMFAGRDASPCFATGNFTVEGAQEPIDGLEGKSLVAILEWAEFYENSDKYEYMGILAGGIFYDENGEETELRKEVMGKAVKAKEEADRLKEEKKKEREKRRAERNNRNKNKKK